MNKKKIIILLGLITILAIGLHLYKAQELPVCLNADEASFGYNAYSILKTGKDEYGTFLPLRLKSFGDYKLPLFSYASIPFIAIFGLSEFSVRLLPNLLGILFPLMIFFLLKEIFKNEKLALIGAFLAAISPWIQITSRHAHEATLAVVLLSLTLYFFIKYLKKDTFIYLFLFSLFNGLSLFTYHISRVMAVFFFLALLYILFFRFRNTLKKIVIPILIFLIPISIFLLSDISKTTRLSNLIYFSTSGFTSNIEELRSEDPNRVLHNKLTQSIIQLTSNYTTYFSPQFLVTQGDQNKRFGYSGISFITIIEFLFIFIGLYYLFKKKEKYRFLILSLLAISPMSAALSWQEASLTRDFFMIVPLLLIMPFGIYHFFMDIKDTIYGRLTLIIMCASFLFFLLYSWDFYFKHYGKKALVLRSWQCGYKELVAYTSANYNKFNEFNITDKNGEPYIFFLFYMKYDPNLYQKQASLSNPDQYGFGQVYGFDKFNFRFNFDKPSKDVSYIGYPEDFNNKVSENKLKKIKIGTENIFWIYED